MYKKAEHESKIDQLYTPASFRFMFIEGASLSNFDLSITMCKMYVVTNYEKDNDLFQSIKRRTQHKFIRYISKLI